MLPSCALSANQLSWCPCLPEDLGRWPVFPKIGRGKSTTSPRPLRPQSQSHFHRSGLSWVDVLPAWVIVGMVWFAWVDHSRSMSSRSIPHGCTKCMDMYMEICIWNCMEFYRIVWNFNEFYRIVWNCMELYGIKHLNWKWMHWMKSIECIMPIRKLVHDA